jgi:PAS domain S-box-containing protein
MDSFSAIFQHAHIGIIIANTSGEIEQVNRFASNIFGFKDGELIGQKIEVLIPESIRIPHVLDREKYAQNPVARSMGMGRDLSGLRKCGEIFPVEISLCSYDFNHEKKMVSFINDITARKKSDNELKKLTSDLEAKVEERTTELSQALVELSITNENLKKRENEVKQALESEKEINEMKSRFVSMASHEFRTPLAGILSSATLLEKYQEKKDLEKREKHISRIKKSVKNLTSILTDFLSLDKLEQGITQANLSTFQLNEVIEEVLSISEGITEGQSFHYVNECPARLKLYQDIDMLRNVLINLISNAIKYSEAGTVITVKVSLTSDNGDNNKSDAIEITISDKGMGIPKSEQKYLFGRFFRAENAMNFSGTGLGLNIVKRYIELMRGGIHFESKIGEGTSFIVKLPIGLKK